MAGFFGFGSLRRMLFPAVMGLLTLSSCTGHRWVMEKGWHERNARSFLEHRVENDRIVDPGYDHPCILGRDDLKSILSALKYRCVRPFEEPVTEPVFGRHEVESIAKAMEQALSSAQTWQRVRFASFNRGEGILFSMKRKTEGVIFREKNERLNIAFVEINEESDPTMISDPELEIGQTDPLKVEHTRAPLEPQPGYTLKYDDIKGKSMPLWAVIDLGNLCAIRDLVDISESADTAVDGTRKRQRPIPAETGDQAEDPRKSRGDETARPEQGDEADPVYEALKRIKLYYEEGLINEKEYEAKKKQLMDHVK